jgi:hypothetical protein
VRCLDIIFAREALHFLFHCKFTWRPRESWAPPPHRETLHAKLVEKCDLANKKLTRAEGADEMGLVMGKELGTEARL